MLTRCQQSPLIHGRIVPHGVSSTPVGSAGEGGCRGGTEGKIMNTEHERDVEKVAVREKKEQQVSAGAPVVGLLLAFAVIALFAGVIGATLALGLNGDLSGRWAVRVKYDDNGGVYVQLYDSGARVSLKSLPEHPPLLTLETGDFTYTRPVPKRLKVSDVALKFERVLRSSDGRVKGILDQYNDIWLIQGPESDYEYRAPAIEEGRTYTGSISWDYRQLSTQKYGETPLLTFRGSLVLESGVDHPDKFTPTITLYREG